jgi:hypothetical protein
MQTAALALRPQYSDQLAKAFITRKPVREPARPPGRALLGRHRLTAPAAAPLRPAARQPGGRVLRPRQDNGTSRPGVPLADEGVPATNPRLPGRRIGAYGSM